MHMDERTIDAYVARALEPDELRTLDLHVSECLRCTLAVEATVSDERHWDRRGLLGRLVRAA
jgi:hypothetical protein